MKDCKWIHFFKKHYKKIIAAIVSISLLISLLNIGGIIALFRAAFGGDSQISANTEPTNAPTTPEKDLTDEQELQLALTQLTSQIEKDPDNPELYTKRAAVYYNLGKTNEAIKDYTQALEMEDAHKTHYLRAIVYASVGNNKDAYTDLTAALEAEPDNRDYLSLMADTCNALQKYEESLTCLQKLLSTGDGNCVLYALAADACVYLNDFEKAVPHYEKAIELHNAEAEKSGIVKANLYSAYGNSLKSINRFADAAVAYDNSLQLADSKELYFQRGFCLLQTEKYSEAIQDFTHCIEIDYEASSAHFQRGLCYYATNKYTEAIGDFQVYEAASPDKTDSFLYMGLCYQNLKEYDSAIGYYNKCIKAGISKGSCYFNLGNCYYNQKNYAKAVDNYTESIGLNSYKYESLLNRGLCYIQLNKYNEAKVDLKLVIDECKDESLVKSAKESYDPIKNITIITKK